MLDNLKEKYVYFFLINRRTTVKIIGDDVGFFSEEK
jgi:hypothetical protein